LILILVHGVVKRSGAAAAGLVPVVTGAVDVGLDIVVDSAGVGFEIEARFFGKFVAHDWKVGEGAGGGYFEGILAES
jgi:hypothetical protein